jgi:hypothetical protein
LSQLDDPRFGAGEISLTDAQNCIFLELGAALGKRPWWLSTGQHGWRRTVMDGMPARYIKIIYRCERRKKGWAPAFDLCLVEGSLVRVLPHFSPMDSRLTLPTQEAAESWCEEEARHWCRKNFPGRPVQSNRIHPRPEKRRKRRPT